MDYDNQVLSIDSSSTIEIRAVDTVSKLILESVVKVTNGVAWFENIGFASEPGSKEIEFAVWSAAVNPTAIRNAFG